MPYLRGTYGCCGAAELYELDEFGDFSPQDFWDEVDIDLGHAFNEYTCIVFSDVVKGNGDKLANWIRRHKFGLIVSSRSKVNSKSGNKIKIWVWTPNEAAKRYINR